MKTLLRILIILFVASIIGGLMVVGVNASHSASTEPVSEPIHRLPADGAEFRPDEEGGDGIGFPSGVVKALVLMTLAGGVYSTIVWAGKKAKRIVTA